MDRRTVKATIFIFAASELIMRVNGERVAFSVMKAMGYSGLWMITFLLV